jgi:hypothetical protein
MVVLSPLQRYSQNVKSVQFEISLNVIFIIMSGCNRPKWFEWVCILARICVCSPVGIRKSNTSLYLHFIFSSLYLHFIFSKSWFSLLLKMVCLVVPVGLTKISKFWFNCTTGMSRIGLRILSKKHKKYPNLSSPHPECISGGSTIAKCLSFLQLSPDSNFLSSILWWGIHEDNVDQFLIVNPSGPTTYDLS